MSPTSAPFQPPPQVGNRPANTQRQYKRSYMACIRCRQTKAKCEISPDNSSCVKCLRERRDCVFTAERSAKKRKYSFIDSSALEQANGKQSGSTTTVQSPVIVEDKATTRSNGTERQREPLQRRGTDTGYESDVVRTVVSTSHDALGLLFKAVEQQEADESRAASRSVPDLNDDDSPETISSIRGLPIVPSSLISPSQNVVNLWRQNRFVKHGWLSTVEAATYVHLFFRNIAPLSPLASALSEEDSRQQKFILGDPLLCSTILMISTRYHILPGMSGPSRAEFLHRRLWQTARSLIERITFGQDTFPSSSRSLGSIKALLLLTEWFPRALHFPPAHEGWDASLIVDSSDHEQAPAQGSSDQIRWREEVFEPAQRSDKMSWMLLGLAATLGHELGIFEESADEESYAMSPQVRVQMRRLLFLYVSQLSLRLGCSNLLPQGITMSLTYPSAAWQDPLSQDWDRLVTLWIDITKLRKATTEMCFPSKSSTRNLMGSGRYSGILDHFRPLFAEWHKRYSDFHPRVLPNASKLMVFLDYSFVRMYTNSLAIQAVVERAKTKMPVTALDYDFLKKDNFHDYMFIQEVVDASRSVLQIAVDLAEADVLRFCPVRVFICITSASVFLLKAISLGTRRSDLQISLEVLDKCIHALKTNICDDIHLSSRYGMLLERHVRRFRHNFRVQNNISADPAAGGRRASVMSTAPTPQQQSEMAQVQPLSNGMQADGIVNFDNELNNAFPTDMDDWLAQPFDASFAPFGTDIDPGVTGLDMGSLDFLWNLPPST